MAPPMTTMHAVAAVAAVSTVWLLWTLVSPGTAGTRVQGLGGDLGVTLLERESRSIQACTDREAVVQWNHFNEHLGNIKHFSGCGSGSWMRKYAELAPKGPRVLVDIGCNKGYYTAELFGLFAPQLEERLNSETVYQHALQQDPPPTSPCGGCYNCKGYFDFTPPSVQPATYPVTVHSFEPSSTSFARLEKLREKVFPADDELLHWELHNKAVSNTSGTVSFSAGCASTRCSIQTNGSGDTVQATTVDDFVTEFLPGSFRPSMIDVLKIDTEGFDSSVLKGARKLLATQGAVLVYFEYNSQNLWKVTALKDVVADLESFGYVCYFEGRPSSTRITGCWVDDFEIKRWSNVVCATSGHFMHAVLERLSFRAHL